MRGLILKYSLCSFESAKLQKKKKMGTSLLQQSADQSPAIWDLEEVVHREIDSGKWNKVA